MTVVAARTVMAARGGDEGAFARLVDVEAPAAYRLALTITRSPAEAEDAVQDAFVQAWRRIDSTRAPRRCKPLDLSLSDDIAWSFTSGMHVLPGLECFSTKPGEVTTGVVTNAPDGWRLTKPLPVSCRITMEQVASVGLWKLSLAESWTSDVDRSAGTYTLVFWLDPDAEGYGYEGGFQIGGSALDGVGPDVLGDPFPYLSADPFPYST